MDEELVEADVPTVGDRLRAAREEKKLSLEDIAAQTRIPQRHLEAIEAADWEKLPAPTYTVGFAKNYAAAVGLDRVEIGEQLREEMGGQRFTSTAAAEVFEPADPARTMPKWLVIGAIAAVILLVALMSWLNRRSLEQPGDAASNAAVAAAPAAPQAPAAPRPATAEEPVVLTATGPAWVRVTDQGTTLYEGVIQPGQTYQVPSTAVAPTLRVGAPEALRINVGTAVAPQVGPAGQVTSDVSLKPADLMRAPSPQPAPQAPAANRRPALSAAPAAPPAPQPPATNNSAP
jgi:cytoskeletal protein RodZ